MTPSCGRPNIHPSVTCLTDPLLHPEISYSSLTETRLWDRDSQGQECTTCTSLVLTSSTTMPIHLWWTLVSLGKSSSAVGSQPGEDSTGRPQLDETCCVEVYLYYDSGY